MSDARGGLPLSGHRLGGSGSLGRALVEACRPGVPAAAIRVPRDPTAASPSPAQLSGRPDDDGFWPSPRWKQWLGHAGLRGSAFVARRPGLAGAPERRQWGAGVNTGAIHTGVRRLSPGRDRSELPADPISRSAGRSRHRDRPPSIGNLPTGDPRLRRSTSPCCDAGAQLVVTAVRPVGAP